MGELPKSSTYPYSSAPLSLSLSLPCPSVDPPSRIFVSRQSIRQSQFTVCPTRIRGIRYTEMWKTSSTCLSTFSAREENPSAISKVFGNAVSREQASKQPGLQPGYRFYTASHTVGVGRGRGARRCDTESLEIRLQIYSSRHSWLDAERKLTGPFTNPEIIDDGDDLVEGLFPDVDHLNHLGNESPPFDSRPIKWLTSLKQFFNYSTNILFIQQFIYLVFIDEAKRTWIRIQIRLSGKLLVSILSRFSIDARGYFYYEFIKSNVQ